MRRFLSVLVPLALFVSACTPSSGDTSSSTSSSSSTITVATTTTQAPDGFGGEVTLGVTTGIETLNPFAPSAPSTRVAGNAIWAMVYTIDPETWARIPGVVTVLPSRGNTIEVNADGTMTVRYEIRPGATWSDGTPMTGEDIAFTAEAMKEMAQQGNFAVDPIMATVVGADAVERLAYVTFEEPNLAFEDALWIVLPSHALAGVDLVNGTDGSDWPSGGPFIVDSFDPPSAVRFVRNDRYWKADETGRLLPYLDAVTMRIGQDDSGTPTSYDDFVDGVADIAMMVPLPETMQGIRTMDSVEVDVAVSGFVETLTFQFDDGRDAVNEVSLNDELDYRRAIATGIDRAALIDETSVPWVVDTRGIFAGVGENPWDGITGGASAAKALIDGLGIDDPQARLSTTGNADERPAIGDALEAQFGAFGVGYEPIYLDSVLFFGETLSNHAFDLGLWAWVSDGSRANQLGLLDLFDPAGQDDLGGWAVLGGEGAERFSEIVAEAKTTADPEQFDALVAEAESILADVIPMIPLFRRTSWVVYRPDIVTGVQNNGSIVGVTWNLDQWQRVGE